MRSSTGTPWSTDSFIVVLSLHAGATRQPLFCKAHEQSEALRSLLCFCICLHDNETKWINTWSTRWHGKPPNQYHTDLNFYFQMIYNSCFHVNIRHWTTDRLSSSSFFFFLNPGYMLCQILEWLNACRPFSAKLVDSLQNLSWNNVAGIQLSRFTAAHSG